MKTDFTLARTSASKHASGPATTDKAVPLPLKVAGQSQDSAPAGMVCTRSPSVPAGLVGGVRAGPPRPQRWRICTLCNARRFARLNHGLKPSLLHPVDQLGGCHV